MKRFLRKLSLFLVFSAALNVLVLIAVLFFNRLAISSCDLPDDIRAVIAGDSHTMWSIDAGAIDKVENISLNAEGYVYTYYKLKHLLDTEPNISHVYLGFGYHNLSGYFDDYIYGYQLKYFIHRYLGVIRVGDFIEAALRTPGDIPEIVKVIYQSGTRSALKQECTLYESFPEERKLQVFNSGQMRKRIGEQYYDNDGKVIDFSKINLEFLERIITFLRENNIKVTLLNTPLHREYVELIPKEYKQVFDDFVRRNQLEVYSFEDLSLSDLDFLPDGDHVNYTGAMLTTEKFRYYHESTYE